MKKILIADASKASLVMTSEVFKDHFPGVHVLVARTSAEALDIAKREEQIDAFVIDFDLPDKDGAFTASRIKKLFPVPVLITAFDRPEVQSLIEKHCSAYDDCLSWLAKPVNSELVVSIAQRFIEGNYRTQRRIDCMIPGMAELNIGRKSRKAREAAAAAGETPEKVCIPMMLEDCSVGGFKFRLMKKSLDANKSIKIGSDGKLNVDGILTVYMPSFESIQTGEDNVGYWLWGDSFDSSAASSEVPQNTRRTRTSLTTLRRTSRQSLGNKNHEGQAIKGTVMWITRDGDDVLIGVQSDNLVLSKKLFEAILIGDSRMRNRRANAQSQKELIKGYHGAPGETPRPRLEVISGSFNKSNAPMPTIDQPALALAEEPKPTLTKKTAAPKLAKESSKDTTPQKIEAKKQSPAKQSPQSKTSKAPSPTPARKSTAQQQKVAVKKAPAKTKTPPKSTGKKVPVAAKRPIAKSASSGNKARAKAKPTRSRRAS